MLLAGADSFVLANDVASLEQQLKGCAGLLVTGGWDIDPARFGAEREAATEVGDASRDDFELTVMHVAREREIPLLASIVGATRFATGSRHHQAVGVLAPALRVVATTPDGVIEALEARFDASFWLAVQWHPESTLDDGGPSRAIFSRFVEECSASAL